MTRGKFPAGKFMTVVKVGPKGQIVIPVEVREMFGIAPGDSLLLLADRKRGIALPPQEKSEKLFRAITASMDEEAERDECD